MSLDSNPFPPETPLLGLGMTILYLPWLSVNARGVPEDAEQKLNKPPFCLLR
jgi:hypothetical protein